jgi:hypothetical protein
MNALRLLQCIVVRPVGITPPSPRVPRLQGTDTTEENDEAPKKDHASGGQGKLTQQ